MHKLRKSIVNSHIPELTGCVTFKCLRNSKVDGKDFWDYRYYYVNERYELVSIPLFATVF